MYKPIKTSEQHDQYLARVYELMQIDLKPNSKESDELEGLSILIEAHEKQTRFKEISSCTGLGFL